MTQTVVSLSFLFFFLIKVLESEKKKCFHVLLNIKYNLDYRCQSFILNYSNQVMRNVFMHFESQNLASRL